MRTLVLILMIALLPARMWAAEGMAVRMASDQVMAASGASATGAMPEDCPMMAKAKAEKGSGDDAPQTVSHCMACHLCAASACLPEFALEQGPAPTGPPETAVASFDDAELAPDLRPPIA